MRKDNRWIIVSIGEFAYRGVGSLYLEPMSRYEIPLQDKQIIPQKLKVEQLVGGRVVTISGDLNKNNILIRDEPDKFDERVMMIDYELAARDYRGRDIGQVFAYKVLEMNSDGFRICGEYPDETWRRSFVTEYLKQTKSLNYFEWDEKLDCVDHVLMEAEFFVFHSIHMITGIFINQNKDSVFYNMPADIVRSMLNIALYFINMYYQRKAHFIETYSKLLDSNNLSEIRG